MDSLQEEVKTNNPSSSMVARVTEMEAFLKEEENFYEYASDVVANKTRQTRKDKKTLLLEAKAHVKPLKTLEGTIAGLKVTLHDLV